MCQTITSSYSCGCLQDTVSIPCENPTSRCARLTQTFQKRKTKGPCPKHQSQRTSRYLPSGKSLRHQSVVEHLRSQAISTQPNRPYRVPVPENEGLRHLEHKLEALQLSTQPVSGVSSKSKPKRIASSKSRPFEAVEPPILPQSSPRRVPTRKPVPLNVMSIPVYDNGTNASFQEAMKLKNAQRSSTTASGSPASREHTRAHDNKLPPSSFLFGSSSREGKTNPFNNPFPRRKSSIDSVEGAQLYPSPLKISKSSAHPNSHSNRSVHHVAHLAGIDKHRNRPLPATPTSMPQKQARNRMTYKNSHDLLSAAYKARAPTKAPHVPPSNPGNMDTLGRVKSLDDRSKTHSTALQHNESVRVFKERQASELRVLNAKRAFDNGRWNLYRNCYEMEVLTPDERREVNTYIREKRDNERKTREEEAAAAAARQKRASEPKPPERGKSVRSVSKKIENGCTVM